MSYIDEVRADLEQELMEWRDAGAPVEAVIFAIERLIRALISEEQQ